MLFDAEFKTRKEQSHSMQTNNEENGILADPEGPQFTNTSSEQQLAYEDYMQFDKKGDAVPALNSEKLAKKIARKKKAEERAMKRMGNEGDNCCRADKNCTVF